MTWFLLIFVIADGGRALTTMPFATQEQCNVARQRIRQTWHPRIDTICIQSDVKEAP